MAAHPCPATRCTRLTQRPPAPPQPATGGQPDCGTHCGTHPRCSRRLLAPCSAAEAEAQEFVAPAVGAAAGPIHMKVTYVEGLCLDGGDASGHAARVREYEVMMR